MAATSNDLPTCGLALYSQSACRALEEYKAHCGGAGPHGARCLLGAMKAIRDDSCKAVAVAAWAKAHNRPAISADTVTAATANKTYAANADSYRDGIFAVLCGCVAPGTYAPSAALQALTSFGQDFQRDAALTAYLRHHGGGWQAADRKALAKLYASEFYRDAAVAALLAAPPRSSVAVAPPSPPPRSTVATLSAARTASTHRIITRGLAAVRGVARQARHIARRTSVLPSRL